MNIGGVVYFELDLEGQLNKYQDLKALGSTVLALSVGEVPPVRQRTPISRTFTASLRMVCLA